MVWCGVLASLQFIKLEKEDPIRIGLRFVLFVNLNEKNNKERENENTNGI